MGKLLYHLALIVCGLSCVGCFRDTGATEVYAQTERAVTVSVTRVEPRELARELTITAEFRPYQEVDVHAKVAGFLRSISVDVGDRVATGQELGVLEVPELREDLAYATAAQRRTELDVERARSEVALAQTNLEIRELSWRRLADVSKARPGLLAQQELDDAQAKYREAVAQRAAAKATLAATEEQVQVSAASKAKVRTIMNYLRVTAPFAGVITKRYADTGAMIQAGTASQTQAMPLVRVAQDDRLRLTLPVPESAVPRISVGTPVEVRAESLKVVFQGSVSRFTGQVDAATRTMLTEVDLPNRDHLLKPGMIAQATLRIDRRDAALAAPIQALRQTEAGKVAMVVNRRNRIEERVLATGIQTPYLVEVLEGLSSGEMVVMGSRVPLRKGQLVAPMVINGHTEAIP
jgi:RND family efflux transporter MFP subunit